MAAAQTDSALCCTVRQVGADYHAFRGGYDDPFALIKPPARNGGRRWAIIYRDPRTTDPFAGHPNAQPERYKDVEAELRHAVRHCTPAQLGLAP